LTWLLSREEREQYVIQLYKENKSVREIAKLMHMSFRDIGTITKKIKSEVERERGHLDKNDDIKSKSKTTQAIKLFCEGKNTVDVVIALDLPADEVRTIYREYWELKQMYELGQIYDEAEYDLHKLLRLHKIVKGLEMKEHDIHNVLALAKNNQLQYLQWKVEYLRNDVDMLEAQKTKCTNDILKLNTAMGEIHSLQPKGGEMTYMNQEPRMLKGPNSDDAYPTTYTEPYTSYSIFLTYL
jgi:transposase